VFGNKDLVYLSGILIMPLLVTAVCPVGVAIGLWWLRNLVRDRELKGTGPACGLQLRGPLTEEESEALGELPLFRVARQGRVSSSTWVLAGQVAGYEVRVFDLGFVLSFRGLFPGPLSHRAVQTVAVLSAPGLPLRFHCGAATTPWQYIMP